MRRLSCLLLAVLACAPAAPSRGDGVDTVSAEELAIHFGVRSWVTKIRLDGSAFLFEVFHVVDGKVADRPLLSATVSPTDRDLTRVAILASPTPKGARLSLQPEPGVGAGSTLERDGAIPLNTAFPLPRTLTAGDYILGGDIPYEAYKDRIEQEGGYDQIQARLVGIVKDVKDGLLLRVTKKE